MNLAREIITMSNNTSEIPKLDLGNAAALIALALGRYNAKPQRLRLRAKK
jgi:hypothetical protein